MADYFDELYKFFLQQNGYPEQIDIFETKKKISTFS